MQAVLHYVGILYAAQVAQPTGRGIAVVGLSGSAVSALAGLNPCPGASLFCRLRQQLERMDSCPKSTDQ